MTNSKRSHQPVRWHWWWRWLAKLGLILTILSSITGVAGFIMAFIYPDRFDQIVNTIRTSNNEVVRAIESVETALGDVKRETSSDPRKELVNLGYSLNNLDFWRSVYIGDISATRTFCQIEAGKFVTIEDSFFDTDNNEMSSDMKEVVLSCQLVDKEKSCIISTNMRALHREKFDEILYMTLCGRKALHTLKQDARDLQQNHTRAVEKLCGDISKGDRLAVYIFRDHFALAPWADPKFDGVGTDLRMACDRL